MKRSAKKFFLLLLMMPFVMGATAPRFAPDWFKTDEESKTIVVAGEYEPYRSLSREGNGAQIELVKAVFEKAGMNVTVDVQPAKSLMIYALSQEGTPAVGERPDFKDVPSEDLIFVPFTVRTARYYRFGHDDEICQWRGDPNRLKGKRVGVESAIDTAPYEKTGIQVVVGKLQDLLKKLLAGQIEVVAADTERMKWVLNAYFPEREMESVPMRGPVFQTFSYVVFNKKSGLGRAQADRFASALKAMLKDGGYEKRLKTSTGQKSFSPGHLDLLEKSLKSLD